MSDSLDRLHADKFILSGRYTLTLFRDEPLLFKQYNETPDAAKRLDLLRQIQTAVGEDAPVVYVVNPYQIVGASKKVQNFTPHPLENYKIDPELSLAE